jgi:hypothetical protein
MSCSRTSLRFRSELFWSQSVDLEVAHYSARGRWQSCPFPFAPRRGAGEGEERAPEAGVRAGRRGEAERLEVRREDAEGADEFRDGAGEAIQAEMARFEVPPHVGRPDGVDVVGGCVLEVAPTDVQIAESGCAELGKCGKVTVVVPKGGDGREVDFVRWGVERVEGSGF